MDITIITKLGYPNSSTVADQISAIIGGPYDKVHDHGIVCLLHDGESRIIWRTAFVSLILPITWPARVTNVGDGTYRVSRPFPWIFGSGSTVHQATRPATVTGRTGYTAKLA